jgi:hypothetical protein
MISFCSRGGTRRSASPRPPAPWGHHPPPPTHTQGKVPTKQPRIGHGGGSRSWGMTHHKNCPRLPLRFDAFPVPYSLHPCRSAQPHRHPPPIPSQRPEVGPWQRCAAWPAAVAAAAAGEIGELRAAGGWGGTHTLELLQRPRLRVLLHLHQPHRTLAHLRSRPDQLSRSPSPRPRAAVQLTPSTDALN